MQNEEFIPDQNHIFPENNNKHFKSNYVPVVLPQKPGEEDIEEDQISTYKPKSLNNLRPNVSAARVVHKKDYIQEYISSSDEADNEDPSLKNPYDNNSKENSIYKPSGFVQEPFKTKNSFSPQYQYSDQNNEIPVATTLIPGQPDVIIKDTAKKNIFVKIGDFLLSKWWLILTLITGIGMLAVGVFLYSNQPEPITGTFDNLVATIEAPQTSASGSPSRWKITLKNNESVSLQNIIVNLNYDRAFKFTQVINPDPSKPDGTEFKIARLDPVGQGSSEVIIQFEGVLTGRTDEETLMQGSVTFTPTPLLSSANSQRTVQILAAKTKITQPQIRVSVLPTADTVQNGGEVEVNIIFQNTSERELRDIRIRMLYPDRGGFSYVGSQLQIADTSTPKTTPDDGNNIWYIPSLPRLKEQNLKIIGRVFGADSINVTFGVNIDIKTTSNDYITMTQSSKDVKIIAQPLVITTRIENKQGDKLFAPGDTLNFVIDYRNKSTTILRDLEILASVDDPSNILDYSTSAFTGGDRGSLNNRTIQWKGVNVPKLASLSPQDGGQLRYTIRVSDANVLIKNGLTQNTYVVTPKVSAKAQNLQPVDFAGDLYKARGLLGFEQSVVSKGFDPANSRREIFAVTFTLRSRQTDVNDVVVKTRSSLINPWQQVSVSPANDVNKITYNDVTGEIIWQPGRIAAYSGINGNPPVSITFNLIVDAQDNRSTRGVPLFDAPAIKGVDDFTGEKYDRFGQAATS